MNEQWFESDDSVAAAGALRPRVDTLSPLPPDLVARQREWNRLLSNIKEVEEFALGVHARQLEAARIERLREACDL